MPAETHAQPLPTDLWERPGVSWLLLTVAAAAGVFWFVAAQGAWEQAGYLHLAFARSLAEGHGFGVDGRTVFGDDSPVWLALLLATHALLSGLTGSWVVTGYALDAAGALFLAAGLYRFAGSLAREDSPPARHHFGAAVVLFVLLSPFWGAVAFSGSEAVLTAGVACWGLAAMHGRWGDPLRPSRLLAGCLCAGLAPLLRPEMLFYSLSLAPLLFVRWANTPRRRGSRLLIFLVGMLLAVGPGAAWLLYTVHTFGTALPNPLLASRNPPTASTVGQLLAGFAVGFPWLLAGAAAAVVWALTWLARRRAGKGSANPGAGGVGLSLGPTGWVPFVWMFLVTLFYTATRTAVRWEEVLLIAPALCASMLAVVRRFRPRVFAAGVPLAVLYGVALNLLLTWPTVLALRAQNRLFADLANSLGAIAPRDRVALAPAGEVVFLSPHPVVDLGGMLDAAVLPYRWDTTDDRRVWWAHQQGARYMVLGHTPEPGSVPVWSEDLPARRPGPGRLPRSFERLMLWRLPPSPTLPRPVLLPEGSD